MPPECRPYFPPWKAPNSGGQDLILVRCASAIVAPAGSFGRHVPPKAACWRCPALVPVTPSHIELEPHLQRTAAAYLPSCRPSPFLCNRRIATGVAVMGAAAAAVLLLVRGVNRQRRVPLGGDPSEAYDPLQRWLTSPVIKTRN